LLPGLALLLVPGLAGAQPALPRPTAPVTDTVRLTLEQAEKLFYDKNLNLLAGRYNVSAQQALVLQARLLVNPTLYLEGNLFNPKNPVYANGDTTTRRTFLPWHFGTRPDGSNGETVWNFQQLILLAGKRQKQIALSQLNVELNEYGLYDLIRNLKFQLRSTFFTIYYLQQTLAIIDLERENVSRLIRVYEDQYRRGNVPLTDFVRLKSFQFSLESDHKNYYNQIADNLNNLMLLIGDTGTPYILPQVSDAALDQLSPTRFAYADLIDRAYEHRYDLRQAQTQVRYNQKNYDLQRALRIPDLQAGINYDRNGNYIPGYYAANLTTALPLFNRNQGNIKSAQYLVRNAEALAQFQTQQVEKDVWQAYVQVQESDRVYRQFDTGFIDQYTDLIGKVTRSYESGSLNLVDFMSYYESYRQNVLQENQLRTDRINGYEYLNFVTGQTLYSY
jgi:cobalt-zinc-cadmium efflux system outer membrane protein